MGWIYPAVLEYRHTKKTEKRDNSNYAIQIYKNMWINSYFCYLKNKTLNIRRNYLSCWTIGCDMSLLFLWNHSPLNGYECKRKPISVLLGWFWILPRIIIKWPNRLSKRESCSAQVHISAKMIRWVVLYIGVIWLHWTRPYSSLTPSNVVQISDPDIFYVSRINASVFCCDVTLCFNRAPTFVHNVKQAKLLVSLLQGRTLGWAVS